VKECIELSSSRRTLYFDQIFRILDQLASLSIRARVRVRATRGVPITSDVVRLRHDIALTLYSSYH
jgi:hypothetical protein